MSFPPLRRPKNLNVHNPMLGQPQQNNNIDYVIITLKSGKKLVIHSDAYHGILMFTEMYKCIFCEMSIRLDGRLKDLHKKSAAHLKIMARFPHIENFSEHLIRKRNEESYYCTVCHVLISQHFIMRHLHTEAHTEELDKAVNRALIYKPVG